MSEAKGTKRSRRKRELTNEQKEELKEAFELFDSDKDGIIDYHELKVTKWPIFMPVLQKNFRALIY